MYEVQALTPNGKNGKIYVFDVKKEDSYVIELHQASGGSPCRSTIVLAKGNGF